MRFVAPLLLSFALASPALAKGSKTSDDDLLGNMGDSSKPAPSRPPPPAPAPPAAATPTPPAAPSTPPPAPSTPPPAAAPTPAADRGGSKTSPDGAVSQNPAVTDRVKAVPRKQLLKRRRLELAPFAGVSLNDPYYTHLSLSGSAVFYPHDAFGVGVGVDYLYVHAPSNNIDAVRQGLTSVLAVFDLPKLLAHLDMYWIPIYGKVSFFNSWIVNFDFYASAGLGAATAFGSHTPFEANVAIGQHYALEQWLALRFEVRDHIFVDTQLANNIPRSSVQNYVMFLAGVSFFVPPTFEYTFQ